MAVKAPGDPRIGYPALSYPGAAVAAVKGLVLTPLSSDTFTRADNASLGAGWNAGSDPTLTIASNEAKGAASGVAADWNGAVIYNSDHYSRVTIGSAHAVSGGYEGPTTRNSATGQAQYAALYVAAGPNLIIYRRAAGAYTAITNTGFTIPALNTGDTLALVSEGSQHTAYINGQPYLTVTDSTITGGSPGLTTFNAMTLDGWQGGNAATLATQAAAQSDAFTRANAGMSVGQAHWSPMTFNDGTFGMVDCPIVSNELNTGAGSTGHNGDYRTTEAWANDHWAQLAVGTIPIPTGGVNTFVGLVTRVQPAGNAGYFACLFGNNTAGDPRTNPPLSYRIYRLDHGTPDTSTLLQACTHNNLASDPTGTLYTLVSQGTRHSLRVGGREICAVTDATYATGTPGVLLFTPSATADNWAAGPV
jgi:hypothetical protein